MKSNIPMEVAKLVSDPNWKGSPLIVLHKVMERPSAAALAQNHTWLLPLVQDSPTKVQCPNLIKQVEVL